MFVRHSENLSARIRLQEEKKPDERDVLWSTAGLGEAPLSCFLITSHIIRPVNHVTVCQIMRQNRPFSTSRVCVADWKNPLDVSVAGFCQKLHADENLFCFGVFFVCASIGFSTLNILQNHVGYEASLTNAVGRSQSPNKTV